MSATGDTLEQTQELFDEIKDSRRIAIDASLMVLADEKCTADSSTEGPCATAIQILGLLRAEEAANALSKRITFVPYNYDPSLTGDVLYYEYFIAADALTKIGVPAQIPMLQVISNPATSAEGREVAAWVLIAIESNQLSDYGESEKDALAYAKEVVLKRLELWRQKVEKPNQECVDRAVVFVRNYRPRYERPKTEFPPAKPEEKAPAKDGTKK